MRRVWSLNVSITTTPVPSFSKLVKLMQIQWIQNAMAVYLKVIKVVRDNVSTSFLPLTITHFICSIESPFCGKK